jgi:hypothetical protein
VLAELSNHQPFVQIRLAKVSEEPPDGYARTETGEVIKIEVTSAWLPGRRLALVVDLTFISDGGMRQAETKRAIADFKDKYGPAFQHLWILWKDKIF